MSVSAPLFKALDEADRAVLENYVEYQTFAPDTVVAGEGEESRAVYSVLEGCARVYRRDVALSLLEPGDSFGEMGLITERPRAASVRAVGELRVARLGREPFERLLNDEPGVAARLLVQLVFGLQTRLESMTSLVAELLAEQGRPRRTEVEVRVGDEVVRVPAGTPVGRVLPTAVDGEPTIAALQDFKCVALGTPIFANAVVRPLTARHRDGRAPYRHSVDLVTLEAAHRIRPDLAVHIGPSLGVGHLLEIEGLRRTDLAAFAVELNAAIREIIVGNAEFRRERWTMEEARLQFQRQGWTESALLMRTARSSTVTLVSCGELYALQQGPFAPSTGVLRVPEVVSHNGDLMVYFGEEKRLSEDLVRAVHPGHLARQHEHWLRALGATSVASFNELCIRGEVAQIIRVSEGFHEKRIGQIADAIAARADRIRVICIAGPSSSGKTTFIKRLSVQLQTNGVQPRNISLDNYYVDRELTVRGPDGSYDFEAFEAIDHALLGRHLRRLADGEEVRTARYNFKTGTSHPDGGEAIHLDSGTMLLLEGIHGLNPRLPVPEEETFRIFINPMTSLPLDRVTRVSVSDVRLLRRIVRDRHHRQISCTDNIMRWPAVQAGERRHIFPHQHRADAVFNASLIYEPSVIKVYAERYLLEVPGDHPAYTTAHRLRRLIDRFVAIYPDHVPPTSLLREFIGGSGFEY